MTYEEALKEAEENVKKFPSFTRDGREWVNVNGSEFPKSWLVEQAARMKTGDEI